VHFEAKKQGMTGMALKDIPAWREVLADVHLVLPIAVLVWLMMERWSGNYAAFCATVAMVAVSMLKKRSRMSLRDIVESLAQAGLTMAPLAVSIAGAGIIVSALTATGMVVAFGGIIKGLADGNLGLLLVLLALTVLVLGLGIPTTPSYIIAAAIGVPQVLELGAGIGVDPLAAHLFVFYFAVIADATPPVAAAAFAAAAIAKASPTITSVHATRFGIAGFTVGFAFIYDPGIMLRGSLFDIVLATSIQVVALTLITASYAGFLWANTGWVLRILMGVAGLTAAFAHVLNDLTRFGFGAGVLATIAGWQWAAARPARPQQGEKT
jgi:TRAP-type uncharacterized transport system fused permease subunit